MIRYYFFAAFLLMQSYGALGQAKGLTAEEKIAEDKENFSVPLYKIGKIKEILVTTASGKTDYEPKEDCSDWKMTQKRARYFFRNPEHVSNNAFWHDYTYTSCYSKGSIKFMNGDEGTWTIYMYGRGTLLINNGKQKNKLIHLYCKKCDDNDG